MTATSTSVNSGRDSENVISPSSSSSSSSTPPPSLSYLGLVRAIQAESAARGVTLDNVWAKNAPWRTAEELLAPTVWDRVQQYPQFLAALTTCASSSCPASHLLDVGRYIALASLDDDSQPLWERFTRICARTPEKRALVWLDEEARVEVEWTFEDLYSRAVVLGEYLDGCDDLPSGSRVLLCFPPGPSFFVALWACFSRGLLAVPVTPLDPLQPKTDAADKLRGIVRACTPAAFLTVNAYDQVLKASLVYHEAMASDSVEVLKELNAIEWKCIDRLDYTQKRSPRSPLTSSLSSDHTTAPTSSTSALSGDAIAFLQFSSGSTGQPKGVMVSHRNVCANVRSCAALTNGGVTFDTYRGSLAVSWLPTFHDLGLIGFHLTPMLCGSPCVYFSPLTFLAKPWLWLDACSTWGRRDGYHAVSTAAPPFALDLTLKSLGRAPKHVRDRMDLSCVISLILGAEPIQAGSILRFTSAMRAHGLASRVLLPAYGLAENVLHVRGKADTRSEVRLLRVARGPLEEKGEIVVLEEDAGKEDAGDGDQELAMRSRVLVSCGPMHPCATASATSPASFAMEGGEEAVGASPPSTTTSSSSSSSPLSRCPSRLLLPPNSSSGTVLLVDPVTSCEVPPGHLGEVWVTGECVARGYWNDSSATSVTFSARLSQACTEVGRACLRDAGGRTFLRTGDLGVVHANELYLTGRLKELIVVRGKKYSPADLEETLRAQFCTSSSLSSSVAEVASALVAAAKDHPPARATACAIRPGGILCTERTQVLTQHAELVCMVELTHDDDGSTAPTSTATSAATTKQFALHVARSVVKHVQRLPPTIQTQLFRCGARVGARIHRWLRPSPAVASPASTVLSSAASSSIRHTALVASIRQLLLSHYGLSVSEVLLCRRGTLLKTSSGKLRRAATIKELEGGHLERMIVHRDKFMVQTTVVPTAKTNALTDDVAKQPSVFRQPLPAETIAAAAVCSAHASIPVATPASVTAAPHVLHSLDKIKRMTARLVAEELQLDLDTVLEMASSLPALDKQSLFDGDTASLALNALGLDSLRAMQLASRINHEFDLPLPLSPFMLFENPTFDGLVELIWKLQNQPMTVRRPIDSNLSLNMLPSATDVIQPTSTTSTVSQQAQQPQRERRSMPFILGIGTAVPGLGAPQSEIVSTMMRSLGASAERTELLRKIAASSGIERRYSVLPTCDAIYFGRSGLGNNECVETRQEAFKLAAPPLALTSARRALEQWGGAKEDITHVVAVTCTGVMVPGLEFHILTGLGLALTTQRLAVQFMGCFGACSGMKAARAFAMEDARHRVLVVCTELCSLHMQLDERIDNLVGSAIFADGSGAFVVGATPRSTERPIFEMHQNASVIIPNTLEMMAWELTSSGMAIGLGKEIPSAIYKGVDDFCIHLLKGSEAEGVDYAKCLWVR